MNEQWILYWKHSVQPEHGQQVQTATKNNLKNVKTDPKSLLTELISLVNISRGLTFCLAFYNDTFMSTKYISLFLKGDIKTVQHIGSNGEDT